MGSQVCSPLGPWRDLVKATPRVVVVTQAAHYYIGCLVAKFEVIASSLMIPALTSAPPRPRHSNAKRRIALSRVAPPGRGRKVNVYGEWHTTSRHCCIQQHFLDVRT